MNMQIVEYKDWGPVPPNSRPARIETPQEAWLHFGADGSAFTLDSAQAHARYHIQTLGWQHVGYSALVVLFPRPMLLLGRINRVGAHTQGRNRVSAGICAAGNVTAGDVTDEAIAALAQALRIGQERGWWPGQFRGGHRDAPGATTACPGDPLYARIDDINAQAKSSRQTQRWKMLLYAQRGTPDHLAATAAATASGKDVVVTDSKEMAQDELDRGGTVIAVGGPAAEDVPDAEGVVGSHAIDTMKKIAKRLT